MGSEGDHHIVNGDHGIPSVKAPIIDLSLLMSQDSHARNMVINQIHEACRSSGVFHVINHGIPKSVIEGALEVNKEFYEMPEEMKQDILDPKGTADLLRPVKLITHRSKAPGTDDIIQRDVLRLHANPLEDHVHSWPQYPPNYKEKMGNYANGVKKLGLQLFEAITEALNLQGATNIKQNLEKGVHLLCVNFYAAKPDAAIKNIGAPSHSDFSIFTILLQSSPGLQVLDPADGKWKADPKAEGSLKVLVGDHLEILSNGAYKSLFHRVIPVRAEETRVSVISFHSFGMDEVVEPADEEAVKRYKGCSAREILSYIASGKPGRLIDSLKI